MVRICKTSHAKQESDEDAINKGPCTAIEVDYCIYDLEKTDIDGYRGVAHFVGCRYSEDNPVIPEEICGFKVEGAEPGPLYKDREPTVHEHDVDYKAGLQKMMDRMYESLDEGTAKRDINMVKELHARSDEVDDDW